MDPFSILSGGEAWSGSSGRGGGARGGRRRRRRDAEDAEDGLADAAARGVIGNEALGAALTYARAACDEAPYDETEGEDDAPCVACVYVAATEDADEDDADKRDVLRQLHDLILANHNCRCSDRQLVEMVHEFYEREIRAWRPELGAWSRRAIYNHIYHHMGDADVQAAGLAQMLYAQIQSLRLVCWQTNPETGSRTPHAGNIKLLADLVAKHQALVDARKKRAK